MKDQEQEQNSPTTSSYECRAVSISPYFIQLYAYVRANNGYMQKIEDTKVYFDTEEERNRVDNLPYVLRSTVLSSLAMHQTLQAIS